MDETGNRKRKREEQRETGECASSKDSAADDGKDAAGYIHDEKNKLKLLSGLLGHQRFTSYEERSSISLTTRDRSISILQIVFHMVGTGRESKQNSVAIFVCCSGSLSPVSGNCSCQSDGRAQYQYKVHQRSNDHLCQEADHQSPRPTEQVHLCQLQVSESFSSLHYSTCSQLNNLWLIVVVLPCRSEANDLALRIAEVVTGHSHCISISG